MGIDTRDLRTAISGQKTYLEELVRAFKNRQKADIELVLLDTRVPAYLGNHRYLRLAEHLNLHFWKQVVLPLKAWWRRCDVLFTTDYHVPFFRPGFKTVTVFHDAFFFEDPEHYSPLFLKFFHRVTVPAAKKCSHIVVPSIHVQKKLEQWLQLPAQKLVPVYEAPKSIPKSSFSPEEITRKLTDWGIRQHPYILHVGMLNKRKNIPLLIGAFNQVASRFPDMRLVLAGSLNDKEHINDREQILAAIRLSPFTQRIVLTGYVPDADLSLLYGHASLYVFPSLNEGFGIPVLEAFAHGVPVLVADNSCLPEIGGDAVLTFNPKDTDALADQISTVLSNPALAEKMKQAGKARLSHFSWQKAAGELAELFRSIA
ncbi:hypothetical protein BUE76_17040 [Cnuella takakiae]|nr:hypothetical protein BUE76_17040 [Cnuella takakiae]